ncbi:hypothetical protein [Deinococcus hopiensis]|uniref:Uncharacterized protein n=1 Tax=Deinococcus hopiensis KR-140 TaxID=695939 RepID=A0A1W1VQ45_9DEIO|nr:hypothetical protein [Deinococcus hopiensis]SMB95034.1 hypothetical protein SAMN00790413_02662 [Deinococcus hopiensis KR-140]
MRVLNVPVPPALQAAWPDWLASARQPFFLTLDEAAALPLPTVPHRDVTLPPELRDTYALWNLRPDVARVVWLTETEWEALEPAVRRSLVRAQVRNRRGAVARVRAFADLLPALSGAHFVWWPSLATPAALERVLSERRPACQREQVPAEVWTAAAPLLPRARELAGTFPHASGPNCFGTVMAAAGVEGAEREWMQRAPFEAFLAQRSRPVDHGNAPGTVLVWRDASKDVQHAAVTLGPDWALHKPSQSWMTPRVVLPLRDLILSSRSRGLRLERRCLQG